MYLLLIVGQTFSGSTDKVFQPPSLPISLDFTYNNLLLFSMVGSGRNSKSMVILERSFGGDKREKMSQGGGDRKGGNRFEPLNNDTDNPDIDDFERAIRLSLMDQERGKVKI